MSFFEISAISLSPYVNVWLANSLHPRTLHVFDRVCNLINERRDVLSIVTPQIGNGPFNLVVQDGVLFSARLNMESPISISVDRLWLGDLNIKTAGTKSWAPRPDWELLHSRRDEIFNQLILFSRIPCQSSLPTFLLSTFITSVIAVDIPGCRAAAQNLAGLGIGLTPAGDDFILGSLYAAWIIHPLEIVRALAEEIAKTAAPLTTSLSAAWLRSAGRGEVGILWHDLFDALLSSETVRIQAVLDKILAVGETSGADALHGFIDTLVGYLE